MTFDLTALPGLLTELYNVVDRLEKLAPGRRFTPDGHLVGSIGEAVAAYAYGLELLPASVKGHDARTADGLLVQIKLTQGQSVALSYDCQHLLVLQLDRKLGFKEVYNGPGAAIWQVIGAKADVGRQRAVRVSALARLQGIGCNRGLLRVREFPLILPKIIDAERVSFIDDPGRGTEVRQADD